MADWRFSKVLRSISAPWRRPPRLFLALVLLVALVAIVFAFPCRKVECVVLFGDSITSNWPGMTQPKQLFGMSIVNRGIPGDFTSHMLSRFDHDVVRLHPQVVVILGGINDLVRIPLPAIEQNLESIAGMADQNGIHVVLATLPPAGEYDPEKPSSSQTGVDEIRTLNHWIANFAATRRYTLVDYHSVLADSRGYYLKGLSTDGVHPSARGYEKMEPLLREAIQSAIGDVR